MGISYGGEMCEDITYGVVHIILVPVYVRVLVLVNFHILLEVHLYLHVYVVLRFIN